LIDSFIDDVMHIYRIYEEIKNLIAASSDNTLQHFKDHSIIEKLYKFKSMGMFISAYNDLLFIQIE